MNPFDPTDSQIRHGPQKLHQDVPAAAAKQAKHRTEVEEATLALAQIQKAGMASGLCARIAKAIERFDATLKRDEEVGMRLLTSGQAITFHFEAMDFFNPSLLIFKGTTDDGERIELVQHVSQLSFLLVALPRKNPDQPRRRFGFHPPTGEPTEPPAATDEPGA
jgi:hypothetical protein